MPAPHEDGDSAYAPREPADRAAAGDATTVLYIAAGGTWTIRLGGSILLGQVLHLGIAGVFVAMSSDMWARAPVTLRRLRSGAWVAVYERQERTRRNNLRIAEAAL